MSTDSLDLDILAGEEFAYYGACGNCFKISNKKHGTLVLEAMEDESDGYRSMLDHVRVVSEKDGKDLIFNDLPIAAVKIEPHNTGYFVGHLIKDALIDFEWGQVGTNNHDDYYPSFCATFEALDPEKDYELTTAHGGKVKGKKYCFYRDQRLQGHGIKTRAGRITPPPEASVEKPDSHYQGNPLYGVWG